MANFGGLRRSLRLARGEETRSGVADSPLSPPESGSPYLPLEIKGLVAESLQKSDLKSLRCVSKQWQAMATPPLFDKVYVSPRDKDIQVFSNITKHPVLRRHIKEMVCDTSEVPELSHEQYFHDLCDELRSLTFQLSKKHPFKSPHPELNKFINAIIRGGISHSGLFTKHATDGLVVEGFQLWRELAAQEDQSLEDEVHGMFFSDLCSGLHRLPNLQSVKMDDHIWCQTCRDIEVAFCSTNPRYTPNTILSGSPLARNWNPWHLRPKRSEDEGSERLSIVIRALSRTKKSIRIFECQSRHSRMYEGLSPWHFSIYDISQRYPRHMAIAFCQLQSLTLQITPQLWNMVPHGDAKALGFLPQLLEQITGLKRLDLKLLTAERIKRQRRLSLTPLDDTCYTYSQVFPLHGKWQHLEHLYLAGLAINGLDLCLLLFCQMPRLQRLWLNRIDLLEGSWDGIVEIMRIRGTFEPWALLSLQGSLRHEGGKWWPCTPDGNEEYSALRDYMRYINEGGHHPSLSADSEDSLSIRFFNELLGAAGSERFHRFQLRIQQLEERRT